MAAQNMFDLSSVTNIGLTLGVTGLKGDNFSRNGVNNAGQFIPMLFQ